MKNKQFPSPQSALPHMVGDIQHVFSGKKANFRQYSAVALGALFTGLVLAAAWQLISPASHASVGIPDQNMVTVGHVELTTPAPSATADQDILDTTETDLDAAIAPDLSAIQSQYGDLLDQLDSQYQGTQDLNADPYTVKEDLTNAVDEEVAAPVESAPAVVTPVKKVGFFQKIWSGIVQSWKRVFKIAMISSPAYAATDSADACFAGKNMAAVTKIMGETAARVRDIKSNMQTADATQQEAMKSELDRLSALATRLQTTFDKADTRVKACIADRKAVADKNVAAQAEADRVAQTFKQDGEVSAWMNKNGIDLNVTAQGDVVASEQANDSSSALDSLIRPQLSSSDFSSEDIQTITRAMSLVQDSGVNASVDSDLQGRAEEGSSAPIQPYPATSQTPAGSSMSAPATTPGQPSTNTSNSARPSGWVNINPLTFSLTEYGDAQYFKVALRNQPTAPVTITFKPEVPNTAGVGGGTSISFSPTSWSTEQTRDIYSISDPSNSDRTFKICATVSSADPAYNGLIVPCITGTIKNVSTAHAGI